jgi:hypothetical protein
MKQLGLGLNLSTRKTRKAKFLDEMERVLPWAALVSIVEPHCLRAKTGHPPFAVETMLRIHYLQDWFRLSDPALEQALHDTPLFREFAKIDQGVMRLAVRCTAALPRHAGCTCVLSCGPAPCAEQWPRPTGLPCAGPRSSSTPSDRPPIPPLAAPHGGHVRVGGRAHPGCSPDAREESNWGDFSGPIWGVFSGQ